MVLLAEMAVSNHTLSPLSQPGKSWLVPPDWKQSVGEVVLVFLFGCTVYFAGLIFPLPSKLFCGRVGKEAVSVLVLPPG